MRAMTPSERNAMFIEHATRAWDLVNDQVLARAALARHVRATGKRFIYSSEVR
jgi:hypothetical protein